MKNEFIGKTHWDARFVRTFGALCTSPQPNFTGIDFIPYVVDREDDCWLYAKDNNGFEISIRKPDESLDSWLKENYPQEIRLNGFCQTPLQALDDLFNTTDGEYKTDVTDKLYRQFKEFLKP